MKVACRKGRMWRSSAGFTTLLILPYSVHAASSQVLYEYSPLTTGNVSSSLEAIYYFNCTTPVCFINDTQVNSTSNESVLGLSPNEPLADVILMGALSVVLGLMILITVIGNVFVIAAIFLEKNLQNVANYLVVSLAVADLMVACLVMPLGAVYVITSKPMATVAAGRVFKRCSQYSHKNSSGSVCDEALGDSINLCCGWARRALQS